MIEVEPISIRIFPSGARTICDRDWVGKAPGCANCITLVQSPEAEGNGGPGV
jgi:hypothetical protein